MRENAVFAEPSFAIKMTGQPLGSGMQIAL
jgi:hypothetical protein